MDPALHTRAKKIIDEVLDLPEDSRGVALDAACSGDARLRGHIDALLAAIVREDRFLSGPTMMEGARGTMSGGQSAGASGARAEGERAGARIGPYKLLEKIGEGGFGTVFMAEQSTPIHRRVALKIIKLGMDTRAVVARFEQERQALAMMDHPNIAKVLDAGATELGRPFFVMELVKGEPITAFADANKLGIRERLELFTQVCRAVQHAHTKGIIHRDIKPTNVLVSVSDGKPLCKVIDFGIAKATQRPLTDKTIFTEFRQLVGTPEYMSPEQAGGSLDIDTRTDVYSLGVMLYELLAGVTPFDPERLRSAAFGELQRIIREDEPQRPSTRVSRETGTLASVAAVRDIEARRLGPLIRGELDWIVMRALEKDRARRYESPGNLAADVERYLEGEPVEAAPASVVYRLGKTIRRHRVVVAAATVVLGSLVVGLAGALWQAGVAKRERDNARKSEAAAVASKAESDRHAKEAEQLAEFQQTQLKGIDPKLMGEHLGRDILARAQRGMTRAGLSEPEIQQRGHDLEKLLGDANLTDVALNSLDETIFARAIAAAEVQFKDQPGVRGALFNSLGNAMSELGLLVHADETMNKALAIRRRTFGDDSLEVIESLNAVAPLRVHQGRSAEAEAMSREALERVTRAHADQELPAITALNNLGIALEDQGKLEECAVCFRDLLARTRRVLGDDHADTITIINNTGMLLLEQKKFAEAESYFREALERGRRVLGQDDIFTLVYMSNLALCLEKQNKPAEAEPLYREAMTRSRAARGDDHYDTLLYTSNLGFLLSTLGKHEEAEALSREALQRRRALRGDTDWDTLQSVHNLGVVLAATGTPGGMTEAEGLFREALAAREGQRGPDARQSGESRTALVKLLTAEKRYAEAEPILLASQARQESGGGSPDRLRRFYQKFAEFYDEAQATDPTKGYDAKAAEARAKLKALPEAKGTP